MSYETSKLPKYMAISVLAVLLSPILYGIGSTIWFSSLADSFRDELLDPRKDWPLGNANQIEAAAKKCGVDDWRLGKVFAFHGPQTDELHLSFEIVSLPGEEVEDADGRTWDRTKRVEEIEDCLAHSFDLQGIRVPMIGAARSVSCVGSACDGFESEPQ